MAKVKRAPEVWSLYTTYRYGRKAVVFRVDLPGGGSAQVRVDVAGCVRLAKVARKNRYGSARRGPVKVHVSKWERERRSRAGRF